MANPVNVKIGYFTKHKPAPPTVPNPYDLLDLTVNGKAMQGRPTAWSSEIVDHYSLLGADGLPVVATRVITLCPDCSQGFEADVDREAQRPIALDCPACRPTVAAQAAAPEAPAPHELAPSDEGVVVVPPTATVPVLPVAAPEPEVDPAAALVAIADPFINPFAAGVINFDEMNLDLISALGDLPDSTVSERE